MLIQTGWQDGAFVVGALTRFARAATEQEVEIGAWGHGGDTFADTLSPRGGEPDREGRLGRLVDFFVPHLEPGGDRPVRRGSLRFATLGAEGWRTVPSWPPDGLAVRSLHLAAGGALRGQPGPSATVCQPGDASWSSGPVNRWLAMDLGRAPAYTQRELNDPALLTFTGEALSSDVQVLGFPVVRLRMATTGADGAVFAYLLAVDPDGRVAYVTEGCLRLLHRQTSGPVAPADLGVPRTFARSDTVPAVPGDVMDLAIGLLPVSAVIRRGHRLRVALTGHDASCFARYDPPGEAFTVVLGEGSRLDLPVLS